MSAFDEARAAGCVPYSDPEELTEDQVDPLLWPAVRQINESGWIWTGESCQGHPDAVHPTPWAGNVDVYLRLFFQTRHEGRFFSCFAAVATGFQDDVELAEEVGDDSVLLYRPSFDFFVSRRQDGWTEVQIYVKGGTVWRRDMGVLFWEQFAEEVQP